MNGIRENSAVGFGRAERARLGGLYGSVAALHVVGWGLLLSQAGRYPALFSLGALAYSFGLRHAFDADHISAIDNTTRKLIQGGKRPVGTGFFFSLGHSSVVFLITLALGFAAKRLMGLVADQHGGLRNLGGLIGTSVSGLFLLAIGVLNLLIFLDIVGVLRGVQRGEHSRASLAESLVAGGALTRLFGRLFRFISSSWQMFPVGFLFGLGFDTASEVALLAISAGAASQGLSFAGVMALPLIFAAGMSLVDTTDGAFMTRAYAWAFSNPIRKLFYNLTVTGLSVFVALAVGLIELLQIMSRIIGSTAGLWGLVNRLDIGSVGYIIVGLFVAAWAGAILFFRLRRLDERWTRYLGS